ncbi:Ig-like domain-containing protein [Tamilnaduibacter salinus]|nr:Ig-like domain-containing protein [Tamilnaduibacter salinus]
MSGTYFRYFLALLLSTLLAACGGDNENSTPLAGTGDGGGTQQGQNDNGSGSDNSGSPTTSDVGTIRLLGNPTQITTSTTSSADITARVTSDSGVLMEGVDVSFSVPSGNGTLQVTQATTDASGTATASLSSFGNAKNRTISVRASAGGMSETVDIDVSGTSIALSGPTSVANGDTAEFTARLADADNNGVPGVTITITSQQNAPSASSLTTNQSGEVDFSLTANSSGPDQVKVTAYGGSNQVTAEKTLNISPDSFTLTAPTQGQDIPISTNTTAEVSWEQNGSPISDGSTVNFSTTRGSITPSQQTTSGGSATATLTASKAGPAIITATTGSGLTTQTEIEFVATTPDAISLNASPVKIGRGEQSQITATVTDPNDNPVKDQQVNFNLTSDSTGGTVTSTSTTDSQGRATATFTAGNGISGDDGVVLEASVAGGISNTIPLTVGQQALRITLGTGNEIQEPDSVSYRKEWIAIVTDSSGAPVEGAQLELSVLPTLYRKGQWKLNTDDNWQPDVSTTDPCPVEDANYDGKIQPGEDINGNETLEPSNEVTTSATDITTGTDGSANFELLYPQSQCSWITAKLSVKASVAGSERTESTEFQLSCLASDLQDPDVDPPTEGDGLASPYGTAGSCADPE